MGESLRQSSAAVARALHPAVPREVRGRSACGMCGVASRWGSLCSSCMGDFAAAIARVPNQASASVAALAQRCVSLPPADRAPVLAVLQQIGIDPFDVVRRRYHRLTVSTRGGKITLGGVKGKHDVEGLSWPEAVTMATAAKASLRAVAPDLSGHFDEHFEHLVGLPQEPMLWGGSPLQLDVAEVRANVVVLTLHCGDFEPLVPNLLRRLLFEKRAFGTLTVAASGHLLAARRGRGPDPLYRFLAMANLGLITSATARSIRESVRPPDARPDSDLDFALSCLGSHAHLSFPQSESYRTMERLAPALSSIGCDFDECGVATKGLRRRLPPWSDKLGNTRLDEIVRGLS